MLASCLSLFFRRARYHWQDLGQLHLEMNQRQQCSVQWSAAGSIGTNNVKIISHHHGHHSPGHQTTSNCQTTEVTPNNHQSLISDISVLMHSAASLLLIRVTFISSFGVILGLLGPFEGLFQLCSSGLLTSSALAVLLCSARAVTFRH